MAIALLPDELVFVGTCDLSGHVRGKGLLLADLASRAARGIGIVPSAIMMSAFGPILETPYGTRGDLALVPDLGTLVDIAFSEDEGERFCLADIVTTQGTPWACCPRAFMHRAIAALREATGLVVQAAFEQEFTYAGVPDRPASHRMRSVREAGRFGGLLLAALNQAGVTPEGFMAEYGPRQFEVTVRPRMALRAADEAVITRELIRAVAARCVRAEAGGADPQGGAHGAAPRGGAGAPAASLAPMPVPDGVGNGTHIHFSLVDAAGVPALCDEAGARLSPLGRRFVAGILHHMPALCALSAPSVASYYRLRPGRWAPSVADLGMHDRGAAVRICPVFHGGPDPAPIQFHAEVRVGDATASPYMALGALVWAGLDGIVRELEVPETAGPLPSSLASAMAALAGDAGAQEWMGGELMAAYQMLKASEQAALAGLDDTEVCGRYADAY